MLHLLNDAPPLLPEELEVLCPTFADEVPLLLLFAGEVLPPSLTLRLKWFESPLTMFWSANCGKRATNEDLPVDLQTVFYSPSLKEVAVLFSILFKTSGDTLCKYWQHHQKLAIPRLPIVQDLRRYAFITFFSASLW